MKELFECLSKNYEIDYELIQVCEVILHYCELTVVNMSLNYPMYIVRDFQQWIKHE